MKNKNLLLISSLVILLLILGGVTLYKPFFSARHSSEKSIPAAPGKPQHVEAPRITPKVGKHQWDDTNPDIAYFHSLPQFASLDPDALVCFHEVDPKAPKDAFNVKGNTCLVPNALPLFLDGKSDKKEWLEKLKTVQVTTVASDTTPQTK